MIVGMLQVSASVYSQNGKISVDVSEMELSELIWELQETSGVVFIYKSSDLKGYDKVSISKEDASIEEILNEALEGKPLGYTIDDDVVIIQRKVVEEVKPASEVQQKKSIKGKVTDDQGIPLPGVSVVIKGTNVGVATNIDGEYSLEFDQDNVVLVFSFVGMLPEEIVFTGQNTIDVTLSADNANLSEVVVTGYQKISKERVTGSFVNVKEEDLNRFEAATVSEKLLGQTAGVLMEKSSTGKMKFLIRGVNTLRAGTDPLFVVDGFPLEGDIEDINPNDIESVNILQDASAASIWGARAANGVIVISTKKGSVSDKPVIEFNANTVISPKIDLYDFNLASSSEVIDATKELYELSPTMYSGKLGQNAAVKILMEYTDDLDERDRLLKELAKNDIRKQYEDLFLKTGVEQRYNLSVKGGGEKYKYYNSISYTDDNTQFKGNVNKKITFKLNNDIKLSDRLDVYSNISYSHSENEIANPGLEPFKGGLVDNVAIFDQFLDDDGNLVMRDAQGSVPRKNVTDELRSYGVADLGFNLYDDFKHRSNESTTKNLRTQISLKYKVLKGLNWNSKFIYEDYDYENDIIYTPESFKMRRLGYKTSNVEEINGQKKLIRYLPLGHNLSQTRVQRNSYTIRNQADYNLEVKDFKLTALAGVETRETLEKTKELSRYGYDPQLLTFETVDATTLLKGITSHGEEFSMSMLDLKTEEKHRYFSYFFNANLNYKNKYNFSASYRVDDSDLFGAEKTSSPLFSVGSSWLLSSEDFFNVKPIDMLKLRLTYGQNGHIARESSAYPTLEIEPRWRNSYTGEKYMNIKDHGNKQLTWEVTKMLNFGVDFALLSNKLSGTFEYYRKKSTDVLGMFKINPMYGYKGQIINNAEIKNAGFTFQLSANVGNKLKYRPSFNISHNKNEVVEVEQEPDNEYNVFEHSGIRPRKGESISSAFGLKYAGLDSKGRPSVYGNDGKILTFDDPFLTDLELVKKLGETTPKFFGGFTQELSYNNFTLSVLMTYKLGHIFQSSAYNQSNLGTGMMPDDLGKRWKKAGDEEITDIPKIYDYIEATSNHAIYYYTYTNHIWKDASHVRLNQISLKYQFDKSPVLSNLINRLEIGAQANSLGLIWSGNSDNIDPERNPLYGKPQPYFTFTLKARL
jgi:TonB-linked SusC/RagA family outer membrane protein